MVERNASERAIQRLKSEARSTIKGLQRVLKEVRDPLAGSGLSANTTEAIHLCTGSLEKAYLAKLTTRLSNAPPDIAEELGIAAELAMISALTADDWFDKTPFRSGRNAFHVDHGPGITVITSTVILEIAHRVLGNSIERLPIESRHGIRQLFTNAVLNIQAGQAMIERKDSLAATPASINQLALKRCGHLIGFVLGSVGWLSGKLPVASLTEAGTWIGTALQHRNDIQDFTVAYDQPIKPPLADLLNGQPNLVLIHLFRNMHYLGKNDQKRLHDLHGRNRSLPIKRLKKNEFDFVLHAIAQSKADIMSMRQLAECVDNADNILRHIPELRSLDEWSDYAELLKQP